MKLMMVDIKENQKKKYYPKNALQFIESDALAMFVKRSENRDGGIYLMQEKTFRAIIPLLDTHDIDFAVLSKHSISAWTKGGVKCQSIEKQYVSKSLEKLLKTEENSIQNLITSDLCNWLLILIVVSLYK